MKKTLLTAILVLTLASLAGQDYKDESQKIIQGLIDELNEDPALSIGITNRDYVDLCIGEERRKELERLLMFMKLGTGTMKTENEQQRDALQKFVETNEALRRTADHSPEEFLKTLEAYNTVWSVIDLSFIPLQKLQELKLSGDILEKISGFPFSCGGAFKLLIEWSYGISWDWLSNLKDFTEEANIFEKLYKWPNTFPASFVQISYPVDPEQVTSYLFRSIPQKTITNIPLVITSPDLRTGFDLLANHDPGWFYDPNSFILFMNFKGKERNLSSIGISLIENNPEGPDKVLFMQRFDGNVMYSDVWEYGNIRAYEIPIQIFEDLNNSNLVIRLAFQYKDNRITDYEIPFSIKEQYLPGPVFRNHQKTPVKSIIDEEVRFTIDYYNEKELALNENPDIIIDGKSYSMVPVDGSKGITGQYEFRKAFNEVAEHRYYISGNERNTALRIPAKGYYTHIVNRNEKEQFLSVASDKSAYMISSTANLSVAIKDITDNPVSGANVSLLINNLNRICAETVNPGEYNISFTVPAIPGEYTAKVISDHSYYETKTILIPVKIVKPGLPGHDVIIEDLLIKGTKPGSSVNIEFDVTNKGEYQESNIPIDLKNFDPNGNLVDESTFTSPVISAGSSYHFDKFLGTSSSGPEGYYRIRISANLVTDEEPLNNTAEISYFLGNSISADVYAGDLFYFNDEDNDLQEDVAFGDYVVRVTNINIDGKKGIIKVYRKDAFGTLELLVDDDVINYNEIEYYDNHNIMVVWKLGTPGHIEGVIFLAKPYIGTYFKIDPSELTVDKGSAGTFNVYTNDKYDGSKPVIDFEKWDGDDGMVVDNWSWRDENYSADNTDYEFNVTPPLSAVAGAYQFWVNFAEDNGLLYYQKLKLTVHEPHNVSIGDLSVNNGDDITVGDDLVITSKVYNPGGYDESYVILKYILTKPDGELHTWYEQCEDVSSGSEKVVGSTLPGLDLPAGSYTIDINALIEGDSYPMDNLGLLNFIILPLPELNVIVSFSNNALVPEKEFIIDLEIKDNTGNPVSNPFITGRLIINNQKILPLDFVYNSSSYADTIFSDQTGKVYADLEIFKAGFQPYRYAANLSGNPVLLSTFDVEVGRCQGDTGIIRYTGNEQDPDNLIWQISGGTVFKNIDNMTIYFTWNEPGVNTINLFVYNSIIPSDTSYFIQNVIAPDKIFLDTIYMGCEYFDFFILDAGEGFSNYKWSNGITDRLCRFDNTGFYNVQALDSNGCRSSTEFKIILAYSYYGDGYAVSLVDSVFLIEDWAMLEGQNIDKPHFYSPYRYQYGSYDELYFYLLEPGFHPFYLSYWKYKDIDGKYIEASGRCNNPYIVEIPFLYESQISIPDTIYICQDDTLHINIANDCYWYNEKVSYPYVNKDCKYRNSEYLWNFTFYWDDGYPGYDEMPQYYREITEPGIYSVAISGPAPGCNTIDSIYDINDQLIPNTIVDDCEETLINKTITVLYYSEVDAISIEQELICEDGELFISSNKSQLESYHWSNNSNEFFIYVFEPGEYILTATDFCGDTISDTLRVTLIEMPIVFKGDTIILCEGESIQLDPGDYFETYLWSNDSTTRTTTVNTPDTYSLTVSDSFGCSKSDTINVVLNTPSLYAGIDTTVYLGDTILLEASGGFVDYNWSQGTQAQTAPVTFEEVGEYRFNVNAINQWGCQESDSVKITVMPTTYITDEPYYNGLLIYPNPFTDKTTIIIPENLGVSNNLVITDLTGRVVYQLENIKTNRVEISGNNFNKGVYVIHLKGNNNYIGKLIYR